MKREFPKALVIGNILALGYEPFILGSNNPEGPMVRHEWGPEDEFDQVAEEHTDPYSIDRKDGMNIRRP